MIPEKIKQLLAKERLTGTELGRLLVYKFAFDKMVNEGKETGILCTQEELNALTDATITSEEVYSEFTLYSNMLQTVNTLNILSAAAVQRFYHGFYRVAMELQELHHTNNATLALQLQPLVLTQQEIDEGKAKVLSRYREREQSFCDVFFHVLSHALKKKGGEDEDLPIMGGILEEYAGQPATPSKWLKMYGAAFGLGAITLPDGTRSDQVKSKEWDAACNAFLLTKLTQEQLDQVKHDREKLFFMGAEYARTYLRQLTGSRPYLKDKELLEDLDAEPEKKGDITEALLACYGIKYKTIDPETDTLTKLDEARLYARIYTKTEDDAERMALLRQARKALPELSGAITFYMTRYIPELQDMKKNGEARPLTTQGRLVDAGMLPYKKEVLTYVDDLANIYPDDTTEHLLKRLQLTNAGYAVHHPSEVYEEQEGKKHRAIDFLRYFDSLDKLAKNAKTMKDIRKLHENFTLTGYARILAYNAFFQLLERVYDIPDLCEAFCYDTESMEKQALAYNEILYKFNAMIFGTEEHKAEQRATLKAVFQPIDIEACRVNPKNIAAVEKTMRKAGSSISGRAKMLHFDCDYLPTLRGNK